MRNERVDTKGARQHLELPFGKAIVFSDGRGVCEILTYAESPKRDEWTQPGDAPDRITEKAVKQLQEYFRGKRKVFDVPLSLHGTDFQIKVYKAMIDIPFGETKSYGDIARVIGSPKAFRAVGGACHSNPIPIIVPCHRVVGSDGSLTGFGLGLDVKKLLLDLEGIG